MKWEYTNDRLGKHIIESAEKAGKLNPGMIVLNQ
jgi:cysteine synthase